MTDIEKTFALLEAAEGRQRDEAKRTAQATHEPVVTPEQRHEQFAAELAARLRDSQSAWVTFTTDGKPR
jgi:hypothetical protein